MDKKEKLLTYKEKLWYWNMNKYADCTSECESCGVESILLDDPEICFRCFIKKDYKFFWLKENE